MRCRLFNKSIKIKQIFVHSKPPLTPIVVAPRSWSSWSSGYEARAKKRSRLGWLCAVSNSQPTNPHTRNLLKGPPTRQSLYKPRSVTGGQQDANSRGFGTCQQKTKTATAPGSCYLDRQCRYEEGSQANQQHLAEPEKFLKAGSSGKLFFDFELQYLYTM